ncbi:uncharacterized protein [Musca autumnalis]|uniref:uncharacterized protein n=1 Tax=Musca autumnalis TaxID=221902 RepID=UPI003CE6AF0C
MVAHKRGLANYYHPCYHHLQLPHLPEMVMETPNYTTNHNITTTHHNKSKSGPGPWEALTSLGLLCLVSLLLALLSLIFLLKIYQNAREDALTRSSPEDFIIV